MVKKIAPSLAVILCATVLSAVFYGTAAAQTVTELTAAKVKAILRCPTDESQLFVDDAFELVRLGKVPEQLLLYSFNSARKRPKHQWFYFQTILDMQCEKIGLDLAALRKNLRP